MIFPMRFQDKVCIITGGSSGIGKATAKRLSLEGAKVAILNRSVYKGNVVSEEIKKDGGEVVFIKTDVANPEDIEAAFKIE